MTTMHSGFVSGRVGRFISLAAITVSLLAVCGSSVAQTGASKDMVMYGAAGSIGVQMTKSILPPFEKARNVKVTYQGMGAAEVLSRNIAQRGNPRRPWSSRTTLPPRLAPSWAFGRN